MVSAAVLAMFALSASQGQDSLAKYGLKPNSTIVAQNGKATVAPGETIEIAGLSDLADASGLVYGLDLQPVARKDEDFFWRTLDLVKDKRTLVDVRAEYAKDPDKRTFAMVFRLSPNLSRAIDVSADMGKTFSPLLSSTRHPQPEDSDKSIGEARILKPLFPKGVESTVFNFNLEVPGGEWVDLVTFPFGPDTELLGGDVKIIQRYTDYSDFREVDGVRKIIDYKGYYFTLTLPEALRPLELEIVTNDPASDAALLPKVVTQHFRGEEKGEEFKGKDLFLVYGLRSGGLARRFTLRARPKRFVQFQRIPFVRTP